MSCDFKMISPFSAFFFLLITDIFYFYFFLLLCCSFFSDDNMEICTYWYSNRDLPSQTEAKKKKKKVNTNVLTAKINHNLQAT